jgi:hypothetical protein
MAGIDIGVHRSDRRSPPGKLNRLGALVVLSLSVIAGVYVLTPHRMQFVLDVHDVHRELYESEGEDIGVIQTRLAYTFQDFRSANKRAVDRLFWAFAAGAVLLVVQIGLWTWSLAIALFVTMPEKPSTPPPQEVQPLPSTVGIPETRGGNSNKK